MKELSKNKVSQRRTMAWRDAGDVAQSASQGCLLGVARKARFVASVAEQNVDILLAL